MTMGASPSFAKYARTAVAAPPFINIAACAVALPVSLEASASLWLRSSAKSVEALEVELCLVM
jgi:hypothetical protein